MTNFQHLPENNWYVYVLQSSLDGRMYVGSTNDLQRRLQEHSAGRTRATSRRLPVRLIYFEGHLSKLDAVRRERYFKTTPGKRTLRQVLRHTLNPERKTDA